MTDDPALNVYTTLLSPQTSEADPLGRLRREIDTAAKFGLSGMLCVQGLKAWDPWISAFEIATRSDMVPLVAIQPNVMSPVATAKSVASLARLYGRRVDLNLVAGAAPEEFQQLDDLLDNRERYARLGEFVTVVMSLLSSAEPFSFAGTYYRTSALKADCALAEALRPRVFLAGSSVDALGLREWIGSHITHPEPVGQFQMTMAAAAGGGAAPAGLGIRIGLVVRPDAGQAWSVARERYPEDRLFRHKAALRKKHGSDWSRRLVELSAGDGVHDEVYWTGAYKADRGVMPLLVGDVDTVGSYLAGYLASGVNDVVLGGEISDEDLEWGLAAVRSAREQHAAGKTGAPS